jgi:hypothetical protein
MKKIFLFVLVCFCFTIASVAQKSTTQSTPTVSILVPEDYKSTSTTGSKVALQSVTKNNIVYDFIIEQGNDGKFVSMKFTSKNQQGIQKINDYNSTTSLQETGGTCKDCYNKCKVGGNDWTCLAACILDNCMGW